MNDAWHWWQQALESPKDIGKADHLLVSVDSPEQGFFKMRFNATKPWLPVAIWKEGDEWIALRSGRRVDAMEVWNYCCRHPITSEAYEQSLAGGGWADDDPTVASMMGHNISDSDDLDALADQIENAKIGAEVYSDIQSEEEAAKAQSLRSRMNELAGKADKIREAFKKPHLEAGKQIDQKWMPLVKEAKGVADQLRKYIESFKTAQLLQRRLEERQREEAARAAIREEAPVPPPLPPIDTTIKGNYGRAATVGLELVVTAITDQDALYQFVHDNPDLQACLLSLAQRAVKAGLTVPGVTVEERAKIS
jgi:hypothetical protein